MSETKSDGRQKPLTRSTESRRDNHAIARVLEQIADLLEVQRSNPFRVRAYREAAQVVRDCESSMPAILASDGQEGLEALPGIGKTLASTIVEVVETGRSRFLEHLEGQLCPEVLFRSVPGVGRVLAERLHHELHLDSLEELEMAAHDGRLAAMPGIGSRRAAALRDVLDSMLTRSVRHGRHGTGTGVPPPPVQLLLDIDNEYRVGADLGALPVITPRRFNPRQEAWLPILHAERDGWAITAMYSNSARAHATHSTHDWVVLYYECDGYEGQCTVVTETHGPLFGQRVVRGREVECKHVYQEVASRAGPPSAQAGAAGPRA